VKIPSDAIISPEKLTQYLLMPKRKNDKSIFLAQGGFTQENPDALDAAIRQLIAEKEAVSDREDEYGVFYQVSGVLSGPGGTLPVVTIWIRKQIDGIYRFVTLKPMR
jgi:hypothetical protein